MSQVTNYTDNIQEVKLVDLTKSIVAFDKLLAQAVHFIKNDVLGYVQRSNLLRAVAAGSILGVIVSGGLRLRVAPCFWRVLGDTYVGNAKRKRKEKLGTRYVRVPGENGVMCQVIYPCRDEIVTNSAPTEWIRHATVASMINRPWWEWSFYPYIGPFLNHLMMSRWPHPCNAGARVDDRDGRMPIIVFSHGMVDHADFQVEETFHKENYKLFSG